MAQCDFMGSRGEKKGERKLLHHSFFPIRFGSFVTTLSPKLRVVTQPKNILSRASKLSYHIRVRPVELFIQQICPS